MSATCSNIVQTNSDHEERDKEVEMMKEKFELALALMTAKASNRSFLLTREDYARYLSEVKEAQQARNENQSLSSKQYRRLKRFDYLVIGNKTEKLIAKLKNSEEIRYFVCSDELFNILHDAHLSLGHKRAKCMEQELKDKYANITRQVIAEYLKLCKQCQLKKKSKSKGLVVKPILSNELNSRCQVDLIDMQSELDDDFKFIFNYQDHLTKFCVLRPLKSKSAEEVACCLIDIFCLLGAPCILQSDNGREFANSIIVNLQQMWPTLKLVHGKPRHSQSQGSVERCNQDIRDMLTASLTQSDTGWSKSLRFIQSQKNRSYHKGIRRSPYEAMFGTKQRIGLKDSKLPQDVLPCLVTEEELESYLKHQSNNHTSSYLHETESMVTNDDEADLLITDQQDCVNAEDHKVIRHNQVAEETPREILQALANGLAQHIDDSMQNSELCCVCLNEVSGAHRCSSCGNNVHAICGNNTEDEGYGSNVICNLCIKKEKILSNRQLSKRGLDHQANKMLELSNKKFKPVYVGQNVLVQIPQVDRSRVGPRNVLATVLEVNESGLYKLGTKAGLLDRLYSRNEFQLTESTFLSLDDIPKENTLSLRRAAAVDVGAVQGFISCKCKSYCQSKRCYCVRKGIKCNSKCHDSSTCKTNNSLLRIFLLTCKAFKYGVFVHVK